jgi:hypothetical protein
MLQSGLAHELTHSEGVAFEPDRIGLAVDCR